MLYRWIGLKKTHLLVEVKRSSEVMGERESEKTCFSPLCGAQTSKGENSKLT